MKQKNPHSSCDFFCLRFWVGMIYFLTRPEGKSENKHKKHKKVRISGFFHPNYSPFISRWNNPLIRSPLIHPLPTSRDIQVKHLADKENDPIFEVLKGMGSLKWKVVSQTKTKMQGMKMFIFPPKELPKIWKRNGPNLQVFLQCLHQSN